MVIGIIVFGAVFLVGLALGSAMRRPFAIASIVVGAFLAVLVIQTHDPSAALAVFALIAVAGLVVDSVRETIGILLNR